MSGIWYIDLFLGFCVGWFAYDMWKLALEIWRNWRKQP